MWYRAVIAAAQQEKVYSQSLNIPVSDTLRRILDALAQGGKRALIVGGSVRDALQGAIPKDIDIEVYGTSYDDLVETLSQFGQVDVVGKSFGVIKLRDEEGNDFDFSIPRRESKTGIGHRDFAVSFDAGITPKEAASRRDFTINALAYDPLSKEVHDFFGGAADLQNKVLRHTSPAFVEDPLRVLRGMQFAARFGMDLAPETAQMIREELSDDDHYHSLAKERISEEFMKLATKGQFPGRALQYLKDTGWIKFFPQLQAIIGVPQDPVWHPEGWSASVVSSDAFTASMAKAQSIDLLTRDVVQRALAHSTSREASRITCRTKLSVKPVRGIFSNLVSANSAGIGYLVLSPLIDSPAAVTPPKSFMRQVTAGTDGADKIVRVVFEIPLVSMLSIMSGTVNDLKVVNGVIQSVAVHMVNMLRGQQIPSEVNLHDVPMKEHGASDSRNTDFGVSASIIDPKFFIINDNIVFNFNLRLIGDVNLHSTNIQDGVPTYLVNMGTVDIHTAYVMDAAAEIAERDGLQGDARAALIFAAMGHDLAKATTTQQREKGGRMRWTAHGHEEASGPMAAELMQSIGIKKEIIDRVRPIIERHLEHIRFKPGTTSPAQVRQLADALHPATIEELARLMEADASGRPPLAKGLPEDARLMLELARQDGSNAGRPQPLLQGRDVMPYYQNKGGRHIGEAVQNGYKAQLKGKISTAEEAREWLDNHMKNRASLLRGTDVLPYFENEGGPHIAEVLSQAWQAQRAGEFDSPEGARAWLDARMQSQAPLAE